MVTPTSWMMVLFTDFLLAVLGYVVMSVDEKLEFTMIAKLCVAKEPGRVDDSKEYKAEGEETVQVKEVKSDFESPGTAQIVANSDQKSLFQNQAMEKLTKKMNENERILFSRNAILSQRFQIVGGMEDKIILGYGLFGINYKTIVFEHSPFSYTLGNYVLMWKIMEGVRQIAKK